MNSKSMSIVHVSSAHPYTDNRVHYRECNTLAAAGYDVTLVAVESPVSGPQTDVKVVTIPRRKRFARIILSSFAAARIAFRAKAKVVHMHDPELIPYIPFLRLAGRFVIYDAHEDLPVQILNKSYLGRPSAMILSLFSRALVRVAHMSNLVVCATETIATRFPAAKVVLVRNYPPLREAEMGAGTVDDAARDARIVYVGGLGEGRGAGVMVDAMAEPRMPTGWRLHMAGAASPSALERLQKRGGWSEVDFEGLVAPEVARDIILSARVGFVLFGDSAAHRNALPTKMFEYFAAGVPVIASDFPLWRSIVETNECGILVPPASPSAVAEAVRAYADDPELLKHHSRNARNLAVERLNWAPEGRALVEAYNELLKS